MKAILAAEHFELTPAIRAHAEDQIKKLQNYLPEGVVLRVFLGMCAKREFTVLVRAHWNGHDLIARAAGPDLYLEIPHAMVRLRQKFQKDKGRNIGKRRAHEEASEVRNLSA